MRETQIATIAGKRATAEITDGRVGMQAQADDVNLTLSAANVQPLSDGQSIATLSLLGDEFCVQVELTREALEALGAACGDAGEHPEGIR